MMVNIGKAVIAFNEKNYEACLVSLTKVIEENEFLSESIIECIGVCYINLHKNDKAIKIFNKIKEIVTF